MKYVAEDGTEFTTEKDCLEYEKKQTKNLFELAYTWVHDIIVYDNCGNRIYLNVFNIMDRKFFDQLEKVLIDPNTTYISIPPANSKAISAIKYMNEEYRIYLPERPGLWYYDPYVNEAWESYDDAVTHFNNIWGKLGDEYKID